MTRTRLVGGPPVVRFLLIIQVSNASHEWSVTLALCPINGFALCCERAKHVVGDDRQLSSIDRGGMFGVLKPA